MKNLFKNLLVAVILISFSKVFAQGEQMVNFSLFNEYQKNKDFATAIPYGWEVIKSDPTPFLKYKIFTKMEEALWYMYDSSKISDDQKKAIADTMDYFYSKAIQYEPAKGGIYTAKNGYIKEVWLKAPVPEIIATYEKAIELDPQIDNFYKDRLGLVLATNASEENDYKLKALDLYSKLSEAEPDNGIWIQKIEALADNIDQLIEYTKKSWDLDKDNLEKAWKYASMCIRAQNYEKAVEPLEFLTAKSPDVINYWKQLASAYEKLNMNDKAIKAYQKLISLQPESRDNYLNLAIIYKNIEQLSVSRSYLQKAMNASSDWDYPYMIEGQLYEQSARNCDFDFMTKCVYLLAVNSYRKAASMGGQFASTAAERVRALSNSVPTKEDYFFRKLKSGDTVKIEGPCFGWIGKSVSVP